MTTPEAFEAAAQAIARRAHAGQLDKAGRDYIGHPARVAQRLPTAEARAAGWLHDVVEDTDVTLQDLAAAGIPDQVVQAVDAVTRRDGEQPAEYYARVAANSLALQVKLADIADNADPERLAALDDATAARLAAKYAKAVRQLEALSDATS